MLGPRPTGAGGQETGQRSARRRSPRVARRPSHRKPVNTSKRPSRDAPGAASSQNSRKRLTISVARPARLADQPVSWPRRGFGMVFPITSLEATEHRPRARLNAVTQARSAHPALVPVSSRTLSPIETTAANCSRLPATHTHLRMAMRRTWPPMNSWGIIDPDSRIGTRKPSTKAGAPTTVEAQASVVFGLDSSSPSLVRKELTSRITKLKGLSRQAASSMSSQTRASSSSTSRSCMRSLMSYQTARLSLICRHLVAKPPLAG